MQAYSQDCLNILKLLKTYKNVVLLAPPACGKTRLLKEVADAFKNGFIAAATPPQPEYVPGADIPIPSETPAGPGTTPIPELPSPNRANRKSFPTAFHSGSKQRDFLSGLVPDVASGAPTFKVVHGTLVEANTFARGADGTALVLVDELNRGPAVELFGDSLVAIERDKRLNDDDSEGPLTWPIQILDSKGERVRESLSAHLYLLVAMNQADASVQPIDVAFLRRFQPYRLEPKPEVVRTYYGAPGSSYSLPAIPATPQDVVECAVRAWVWVNKQVSLGRGKDYQLGHGVFLGAGSSVISDLAEALDLAVVWWSAIYAHLEEVFFSDPFSLATAVGAASDGGLYELSSVSFGTEQRHTLRQRKAVEASTVYEHLYWLSQKAE